MRSVLLPVFPFILGLAASATASPTISPWKLHEKLSYIPEGWTRAKKHNPSASIPLRFALTQSNIQDIETFLYDVSHPDSPNYGKHWSPGQIADTFAPSNESIETVHAWLIESGVEPHRVKLSPTKGWLEVTSTVEEAENLLNTEYHVFDHETGMEHVACDSYHLPEHVVPHVDFVTPTVNFDARVQKRGESTRVSLGEPGRSGPKMTEEVPAVSNSLKNCDQQITPDCLRALYALQDYTPSVGGQNSFGIVAFTPQTYMQSDLNMFAKKFSTGLEGISPTLVSIDGGVIQTKSQSDAYIAESTLDLDYGMTLVTKDQKVTLYQIGDTIKGGNSGNFLDALDATYCTSWTSNYPDQAQGGYNGRDCGTVKPANVISTSYGFDEAKLSRAFATRQCNEYAKIGLMGITFLYASGDDGVAGDNRKCLNADGTQSTDGKIFNPSFPSTCPYVTSVGATQISSGLSVSDPEVACEDTIYSGGGFSNYFGMPDYQKTAVQGYLSANPISYAKNIYNSTGSRAFPDLSANGANYAVAIGGVFKSMYGTSASTPVIGAILTMVNDARIRLGKSTIGFINPTIYTDMFAGGFHDITKGTNPGCGTLGFSASKGWDPVTGLGTPNFTKLMDRWLALD